MAGLFGFFRSGPSIDKFESLLQPHINQLYRLAFRYTRSEFAAEDLVQDFLLHIYPKYDELRQIENLRPWLARALYNRFIDTIRKNRRNPLSDADDDSSLEAISDYHAAPDIELEQDLIRDRLESALQNLNENQRLVVMLHDMEGYTLSEVAEIMDVPVGTLKSRLHRARNAIKAALDMEPSDVLLRVKS